MTADLKKVRAAALAALAVFFDHLDEAGAAQAAPEAPPRATPRRKATRPPVQMDDIRPPSDIEQAQMRNLANKMGLRATFPASPSSKRKP